MTAFSFLLQAVSKKSKDRKPASQHVFHCLYLSSQIVNSVVLHIHLFLSTFDGNQVGPLVILTAELEDRPLKLRDKLKPLNQIITHLSLWDITATVGRPHHPTITAIHSFFL